ncbi:MAG: DUF342 domain-containing protein [Deltaproteobacteria bacterium]|nr:DUF342 domain-containing protein [Deltaproteobacteria bacterium]
MRKVSIDEIEAGMVIAADIFDPEFGGELPLIARGVTLTPTYVGKIKDRGFFELLIETPPDYRGAPGETYVLLEVGEDIVSAGNVDLQCDIPPGIKIAAEENIRVTGIVHPGCSIISAKGDIFITGAIHGSPESRVTISAGNRVEIDNGTGRPVSFADIKALDEIVAQSDMHHCSLSAKGKLTVTGKIGKSNIYSHKKIRLRECGDAAGVDPCQLLVKPAECRQLFQALLALDKQMEALQQEKKRLHNSISLVRNLCKNIESLPPDKKMQLALEVKKFQEIESNIASGLKTKEKLKENILNVLAAERIIVDRTAHPNTQITIENYSLCLDQSVGAVAFYVQDMKVKSMPLRC